MYSNNLCSAEKLNLYNPKPNFELHVFRKTFAYSGAHSWKDLSHGVKNAPSIKNI